METQKGSVMDVKPCKNQNGAFSLKKLLTLPWSRYIVHSSGQGGVLMDPP